MGVNAAGVAGVATPPIFDLQGSSCVDDPQYFDKCFIFFLSAELLTAIDHDRDASEQCCCLPHPPGPSG